MSYIDPRIVRTRAAVLSAALELLAERGFDGTTVEGISERCGVARSTIYRHWSDRDELLLDALETLVEDSPVPHTGRLRNDLLSMLTTLAENLTASLWGPVTAALIDPATRHPDIGRLLQQWNGQRRQPMREVLARAISEGTLAPTVDVEVTIDRLVGPVFYRFLLTGQPLDRLFLESITDGLLAELAIAA